MLDQACAHCPIFPTAASRRSLGRVSVPVWLIILSDQLRITGLVGRYPTNYLIRRGPLLERSIFPPARAGAHAVLAEVSLGYPPLQGRFPRATHPSATPSEAETPESVRLACVRHAASVRSEPGSNSQVHPGSTKGLDPIDRPHPRPSITHASDARARTAQRRRPRIPSTFSTLSINKPQDTHASEGPRL